MSNGFIFMVKTFSPLHAGIGQSIGKVDLPIEREKHTEYPCVYATGLKGSLRSYCDKNKNGQMTDDIINKVFGKRGEETSSGEVVFTDLKIVLFPVRSSEGSFKYVTSNEVIERLVRDYEIIYGKKTFNSTIGVEAKSITNSNLFDANKHIILEDFIFEKNKDDDKSKPKNIFGILISDIYIVDKKVFQYLVKNATQIIARNELKPNKTSNNLWYEEALPADSVLYSFTLPSIASNPEQDVLKTLKDFIDTKIIQIGGNETVGYGICEINFLKGGAHEPTKP